MARLRVLVVHQFMPPGSPQDQQRGPMYTELFRAAGMEPTFIGRQPLPDPLLFRRTSRTAAKIRDSLEYRAAMRAVTAALLRLNDRRIVRAARGADVVLLVKTDSPALVRRIREASRARLVYDLADVRRRHEAELMRDVASIVSMVDAVTSDNSVTMEWARGLNPSIHLWPPASYIESFDAKRHLSGRGTGRIRLGWIGTLSTAANLYLVLEALEDVFRSHPGLELRLVGIAGDHDILTRFEYVEATARERYGTADMIDEVLQMDIGLCPMYDLHDVAVHGVTKAIIYMGGGAAVVTSPVGDLRELVREGENGLFATGRAEWATKIGSLIEDPDLRARLAAGGRRSAESNTLERCFGHLRAALRP